MPEIAYVLGADGGEIWTDFYAMPKSACQQAGRLRPARLPDGRAEHAVKEHIANGAPTTDSRVLALLPAEVTANKIVYPDEAALTQLEFGAAVTLTDPARAELMARFKSALDLWLLLPHAGRRKCGCVLSTHYDASPLPVSGERVSAEGNPRAPVQHGTEPTMRLTSTDRKRRLTTAALVARCRALAVYLPRPAVHGHDAFSPSENVRPEGGYQIGLHLCAVRQSSIPRGGLLEYS